MESRDDTDRDVLQEDQIRLFKPDGTSLLEQEPKEKTIKRFKIKGEVLSNIEREISIRAAKGEFRLKPEELVKGEAVFWYYHSKANIEEITVAENSLPSMQIARIFKFIPAKSGALVINSDNTACIVPIGDLHSIERYNQCSAELFDMHEDEIERALLDDRYIN